VELHLHSPDTSSWRGAQLKHRDKFTLPSPSPNIISVIKLMRMRWVAHVVCNREMRNDTKFWMEDLRGKDHLRYTDVDERITLKCISNKQSVMV
jgi:hypothetical protein